MQLYEVELDREKLNQVPSAQRVFLIQLGLLFHEINTLQHWLLLTQARDEDADIVRKTQNAQSLFAARLLAGKLREGRELLQNYFFTKQGQEILSLDIGEKLEEPGKNALKELKQYFDCDSLLARVRNWFAFHYSAPAEKIEEVAARAEIDRELYLANEVGNSFYAVAEEVAGIVMFETINPGTDLATSVDQFFKELVTVARWFQDFIGGSLIVIAKENGLLDDATTTLIELPDPPSFDTVRIPYFLASD